MTLWSILILALIMTLPYYRWFVFFLLVLILNACTSEIPKADVIITNAKIWTGEASQPTATSMAIASDTILAIGSGDDIEQYKHEHTVIKNLEGRMVMPGFIDAHVHLLMGGNALLSVELRDAKTKEEFITRIAEYANTLSDGEWILEGNWDHTLWGGTLPTKEWIDEFTQDIPLVIYRIDGHMVLANSKALEIAGFNKNSADMVAGEIVRYSDGRLTGILKGSAMTKMLNAIPPMTASKKENALKAAANYLLANGITSVHDMDSLGTYGTAKRMLDNGELNIRIYAARPLVHYNKSGNFNQKSP